MAKTPINKTAAVFCFGMLFTAFAIVFNGMLKDGLDQWVPTLLSSNFISNDKIVPIITTILPIFNIFGVYICKFFFLKFHMTELGTTALMFAFSTVAMALVAVMMVIGMLTAIVPTSVSAEKTVPSVWKDNGLAPLVAGEGVEIPTEQQTGNSTMFLAPDWTAYAKYSATGTAGPPRKAQSAIASF